MSAQFMECDTCRAKSGMPVLCEGCLHNRQLIEDLKKPRPIVSPMNLDELIKALIDLRNRHDDRVKLLPEEKGKLGVKFRLCNTWVNTEAIVIGARIESKYQGLYTVYVNSGEPDRVPKE